MIPAGTINQIIANVRGELPEAIAIYLFGSRVHGAVHAESDLLRQDSAVPNV